MEIEGVEFNVLRAFHHELHVDALAWSPESRLDRIPTIRYLYFVLAPYGLVPDTCAAGWQYLFLIADNFFADCFYCVIATISNLIKCSERHLSLKCIIHSNY